MTVPNNRDQDYNRPNRECLGCSTCSCCGLPQPVPKHKPEDILTEGLHAILDNARSDNYGRAFFYDGIMEASKETGWVVAGRAGRCTCTGEELYIDLKFEDNEENDFDVSFDPSTCTCEEAFDYESIDKAIHFSIDRGVFTFKLHSPYQFVLGFSVVLCLKFGWVGLIPIMILLWNR